ncbi:MAG TPA: hypothetical protein VE547_11145, partial [Mycobacteriales bacterium]|nr:hypothetical protein [Mycobacteriales bacterium]
DPGTGLPRLGAPGVSDSSTGLPRFGPPGAPGVADSSAGLSRLGRPGVADPGPARETGEPPVRGRRRAGATRADLAALAEAEETRGGRRRAGAARADLAHTAGSTALQPRLPEPDEVTDTGAHRARSTFRLADEPDPAAEDAYAEEPSLVLQWGIFLAQTLTGAAVGLGVWLGFYRRWSTWPFYAAPAVGAALIGMLVVARALRRRYGHELDLLTAVVTVGVGTVLTVLPAAFTLQGLA